MRRNILFVLSIVVIGVVIAMWWFGARKPVDRQSRETELSRLSQQREVLLSGPLEDKQAIEVIAKLLFLQHENQSEPVTLLIDSPGGSVTAAMAVIDAIKSLKPPVRTRCNGIAQGTAAIILSAGQRGERVVVRESSISLSPIIPKSPNASDADKEKTRQSAGGGDCQQHGPNSGVGRSRPHRWQILRSGRCG